MIWLFLIGYVVVAIVVAVKAARYLYRECRLPVNVEDEVFCALGGLASGALWPVAVAIVGIRHFLFSAIKNEK